MGTDAECLQRAVEGRAASDEEEEDRGRKEGGQRCLLEVKSHACHLHGCGKGGQKDVVTCQSHPHDKNRTSTLKDGWTRARQEKPGGGRRSEKETRLEDKEDRTRLSLLGDKFTDSLTLLLQLRNKNVSRRVLGKMVMDSLEVCSRGGGGPPQVLQAADALCVHLSSGDVLRDKEGADGGGQSREKPLAPPSGHPPSSANSLLISG